MPKARKSTKSKSSSTNRRTSQYRLTQGLIPLLVIILGIGAWFYLNKNKAIQPLERSNQPAQATTSLTPIVSSDTTEMIRLLNLEREQAGCVVLQQDVKLQLAAQQHAEDIAQRGKMDHLGADGANLAQRLDRVGYGYTYRGENIAAGFPTAAEVVAAWMDEPPDGGHRKNILNCVYDQVGVGIAYKPAGYPYWVVDFAEPKQ